MSHVIGAYKPRAFAMSGLRNVFVFVVGFALAGGAIAQEEVEQQSLGDAIGGLFKAIGGALNEALTPQGQQQEQTQQPAPQSTQQVAQKPQQVKKGAIDGKFTGKVPEFLVAAEQLAGVKEGRGKVEDTLYIIFDPRCSACRYIYTETRAHVANGRTVKWIPIIALGDTAKGESLSATILQRNPHEGLRRVLGNKEQIMTNPSRETRKSLELNHDFFDIAFEKVGQGGFVPVAFFLDRRTGNPRMTAISSRGALGEVFGTLAQ